MEKEVRVKQVKIMLTEKEYENFRIKAFRSSTSVANLIRGLAQGKEVKEAMSVENARLLREFAKVGNNINQITKMCREEGILEYAIQIENLMKFLEKKIYE